VADLLLEQTTTGQFNDVSVAAGINVTFPLSATTAVAWGDADGDLQLDLFVGEGGSGGYSPNHRQSMLLTQYWDSSSEKPKFVVTRPWSDSAGLLSESITGARWLDLDADGYLDLLVTAVGSPYSSLPSRVYWGDDLSPFETSTDFDRAHSAGVGDANLDGLPEVVLASTESGSAAAPSLHAIVDEDHRRQFVDRTSSYGLGATRVGSTEDFTQVIFTDLGGDGAAGDGDPDLLFARDTSGNDEFYLENPALADTLVEREWIKIRLNGLDETANEGHGTGAIVKVTTDPSGPDESAQVQVMGLAPSGIPANELLFGLADSGVGASVDVTWPDSYEQSVELTSADLDITLTIIDDHEPELLGSTAGVTPVLLPNGTADWVFGWQTDHSTDPALDVVRVKRDSNKGCPSMTEVTLTPNSSNVSHKVFALANGKFYHRLTWHGQTCGARCQYEYKVQSGTSVANDASGWKTFSIAICAN
jgi:hypothetical protein